MHADSLARHSHHHIFLGHAHDAHERRTRWVVALTAAMMVGEIAAGYLFGSMALLADGWHMATHAGALGMAAAAYAYARRRAADPRFTFGTGKVGDLVGFASALTLALIALAIAVQSAVRLLEPAHVAFGEAIAVAVLGLAVNLASAWMLSGGGHDHHHHGHHGHHGHHHHDNNLRSAYFHVLADALTSVLAILALTAGLLLGWVWLDPVMGIVGAIVIARWSWSLLRDTASVLVDAVPDRSIAREIARIVESDGDSKVADLHIWQVGPGQYASIVSLVAADPRPPADYKQRLTGISSLVHVTVEPNRCVGHGGGAGSG